MLRNCRKSCQTCEITDDIELDALAAKKLELHEVGGDETLLETPYGITQSIAPEAKEQVQDVIRNFTFYMENVIFKDPKFTTVRKTCKNRHADCAFWTHLGECEKVRRILDRIHTCFFCLLLLWWVGWTPRMCEHVVARGILLMDLFFVSLWFWRMM